jgi:hypothetical protein
MQLRTRHVTLIGILALALVACGPRAQPTVAIETKVATPTHTSPQPTTHTSPQPTPDELVQPESPIPTPPANPAVAAAIAHLAAELGLSPADVTVLSVEEMQWSDSSLGCPQPGMMYAQVITPGYRILLEANGETYDVHTNQTGNAAVTCELPTE